MAKVGLKHLVFGELNEENNTYEAAKKLGGAIKADVSITKNDVTLYADDVVAETDKTFSKGSISVETDDISQENLVSLLGHKVIDGEMVCGADDQAPYVGFGFYGTKKVKGKLKYRAVFFVKVQFGEPNDSNSTKGETVTFNSETIEGTIMQNRNQVWKMEQTFDTEEEAIAYINGKFGTSTTGEQSQEVVAEDNESVEEESNM